MNKFGWLLAAALALVPSSLAQTVHVYPAEDTNNTYTGSNVFNGVTTLAQTSEEIAAFTTPYPTLQSAVSAACSLESGAVVRVPYSVSESVDIPAITGGCSKAPIVDAQTFPSSCYTSTGGTYSQAGCTSLYKIDGVPIGSISPSTGAFTLLVATSFADSALSEGQCLMAGALGALEGQNVVCAQASDTLATIISECAAVSTESCTYVSTIPQTFTISANSTLPASITPMFQSSGAWDVLGSGYSLNIASGHVVAASNRQIFSGTAAVTGLVSDYPDWWGTGGTCWVIGASVPCPIVKNAVAALSANGGSVSLNAPEYYWSGQNTEPPTTYTSVPYTLDNITIQGARKPVVDSETAPTTLVYGSIIQGNLNFTANGVHISHFGVDVGSAITAGLFAGAGEDGIIINNPDQLVGRPYWTGFQEEDVIALGSGNTAQFHSILNENLDHAYIHNVSAYLNTHCIAFKGANSIVDGVHARGCFTDGLVSKSDAYAPTRSDIFRNINIASINGMDTGGAIIDAITADAYDETIDGLITTDTRWGLQFATDSAYTLRDVHASNIVADNTGLGTATSGQCFDFVATTSTNPQSITDVNVSNATCKNYTNDVLVANVVPDNIQFVNSQFYNTQNNSIETTGTFTFNDLVISGAAGNSIVPFGGTVALAGNISVNTAILTTAGGAVVRQAALPTVILPTTTAPAFTATDERQQLPMVANLTGFTIANGVRDGDQVDLILCQDSTGGRTLAGVPANVIGLSPILAGEPANACNEAHLTWNSANAAWINEGYNWGSAPNITIASSNGISGTSTAGSNPILTLSLGAINPTSIGQTTPGPIKGTTGTFTGAVSGATGSFIGAVAGSTVNANTGVYTSSATTTVSTLSVATALTGSGGNAGLLVMRDSTNGGTSAFLVDPNAGAQILGTGQITGCTTAACISFGSGNWNVTLSSGTVPRTIVWTLYAN